MTNLILELNTIVNTGPAALNHDRQGNIKTVRVGANEHTRVSSQALKAQARRGFSETHPAAIQTKELAKLLSSRVEELGGGKDCKDIIAHICASIGKSEKGRLKAQIILAPPEVDALVQYAVANAGSDTKKLDPVEVIDLVSSEVNASVAVFGRYMAGQPSYDVYAGLAVSHATDVFPNPVQYDFFSLFDDVVDHSNHVDHTSYSSPVLRTYICLDLLQTRHNLGKGRATRDEKVAADVLEELLGLVRTLLVNLVFTVPTTKQNTFSQNRVPCFVHVSVGKDVVAYKEPLTLPHPHPTDRRSLSQIAVSHYEERLSKAETAYPRQLKKNHFVVSTETLGYLDGARGKPASLDRMIENVLAHVRVELESVAS